MHRVELEGHTHNLIPLLLQQISGRRGIHTTTHPQKDTAALGAILYNIFLCHNQNSPKYRNNNKDYSRDAKITTSILAKTIHNTTDVVYNLRHKTENRKPKHRVDVGVL